MFPVAVALLVFEITTFYFCQPVSEEAILEWSTVYKKAGISFQDHREEGINDGRGGLWLRNGFLFVFGFVFVGLIAVFWLGKRTRSIDDHQISIATCESTNQIKH